MKQLSLWGILLLAVVPVIFLAACGGDGGTNPTATPGSSPQATQPSGNGEPTGPYSETKTLFLTAGNFDSIKVALRTGDSLKIQYEAQSVIVGAGDVGNLAPAGAVMAVNDPLENPVYRGEQKKTDDIELTAEMDGEYQVIFQNLFPLQAQSVTVSYSVNQ